jgi:hypothetical protein
MIGYGISILGGVLAGAALSVNAINAYPVQAKRNTGSIVKNVKYQHCGTMDPSFCWDDN